MKGFVLAFPLVAVIATFAIAGPPTDFKQFRDECKVELGIPVEEKPPLPDLDDPKAKCYHACMMKKLGKMAGGKVLLEKEIEMASKLMPDLDDGIKAKITECVNSANAAGSECDVSHEMHKCLKKNNVLPPYHSSHH